MSQRGYIPESCSPEIIYGKSDSVLRSKSTTTSSESRRCSNSDRRSESKVETETDVKVIALNAGKYTTTQPTYTNQSVSSYSSGFISKGTTNTPTKLTVPMCQPSQYSNQCNSKNSCKTETPNTAQTVVYDRPTSININIPPKNLFQAALSPVVHLPQSGDLPTNNLHSPLSLTQDSNEEIFPSPPPFAFLSPTALAYSDYYNRGSYYSRGSENERERVTTLKMNRRFSSKLCLGCKLVSCPDKLDLHWSHSRIIPSVYEDRVYDKTTEEIKTNNVRQATMKAVYRRYMETTYGGDRYIPQTTPTCVLKFCESKFPM
jgi:hypothetical protein